jgi:hypothetical protein
MTDTVNYSMFDYISISSHVTIMHLPSVSICTSIYDQNVTRALALGTRTTRDHARAS